MRKLINWQVVLGILLIAFSASVYFIHYLIFRDAHHIFIYLIGDIAFVFLEVLMVTLVIHQLLAVREKQSMLNKLNMVIGVFFSEAGVQLLKVFAHFLPSTLDLDQDLVVDQNWDEKKFNKACKKFHDVDLPVDSRLGDLHVLREFLIGKRHFLVNLLENPNLLEHESFTDCLWGVFHLTEEISLRNNFKNLPEADYEHLTGDIKRAYKRLVCEWIIYMKHLKMKYPYLFSLALRINPFNKETCVIFV